MLFKIIHTTDLNYTDMISESVMELRMVPRQEQDQHRLSFNLAIGPATTTLSYFDWLGNTVHAFTVNSYTFVSTRGQRASGLRLVAPHDLAGRLHHLGLDELQNARHDGKNVVRVRLREALEPEKGAGPIR